MTGHEELVILAAARRPGERVAADRGGHGPHGGAQGEPRELDPCADPALLGDVAEVGGETVGEVDHGRHAARSGEPLRSEEHTSELQSLAYLVCRLLLEKKKKRDTPDARLYD